MRFFLLIVAVSTAMAADSPASDALSQFFSGSSDYIKSLKPKVSTDKIEALIESFTAGDGSVKSICSKFGSSKLCNNEFKGPLQKLKTFIATLKTKGAAVAATNSTKTNTELTKAKNGFNTWLSQYKNKIGEANVNAISEAVNAGNKTAIKDAVKEALGSSGGLGGGLGGLDGLSGIVSNLNPSVISGIVSNIDPSVISGLLGALTGGGSSSSSGLGGLSSLFGMFG